VCVERLSPPQEKGTTAPCTPGGDDGVDRGRKRKLNELRRVGWVGQGRVEEAWEELGAVGGGG